jgi:hypothetical protein
MTCILGISSHAVAKEIPPMTDDDLTGVWIGLTSDELYYYRLIFDKSGGGACCFVFLHETPKYYRIIGYKLSGRNISISVDPVDEDSFPISFKGKTVGHRILSLVVSGDGWSRSLALRREDDLEKRSSIVKIRMQGETIPQKTP